MHTCIASWGEESFSVLTVRIVCPPNLNCRISLPYRRRCAGQSRQRLAVHVLDQTEFSSCSSVHLSLWASSTNTTARTAHGRGPRSPPRAHARVVKHTVRNFDVVCPQLFGVKRWLAGDPCDRIVGTTSRRVFREVGIRLREPHALAVQAVRGLLQAPTVATRRQSHVPVSASCGDARRDGGQAQKHRQVVVRTSRYLRLLVCVRPVSPRLTTQRAQQPNDASRGSSRSRRGRPRGGA